MSFGHDDPTAEVAADRLLKRVLRPLPKNRVGRGWQLDYGAELAPFLATGVTGAEIDDWFQAHGVRVSAKHLLFG